MLKDYSLQIVLLKYERKLFIKKLHATRIYLNAYTLSKEKYMFHLPHALRIYRSCEPKTFQITDTQNLI